MTYAILVFLPIVMSAISGIFQKWLGARVCEILTTAGLFVSLALSLYAFYDVVILENTRIVYLWDWISSGDFDVRWTLRVDSLTAVMLLVVNGVSALVHFYSIGYMADDPGRPRFFSYLSLFTFAMLMLVTANSFLQVFFGWEGVGLASYLLIGFWYKKPSANAAALKAFVVNRVGDFGFMLGIFAIYWVFGSLDFDAVFGAAPAVAGKTFLFAGHRLDILTTICLLLFVGAMGKSAQIGLHTWLPDAMEGPTPVSALIHAATMVTAGVFLVCRASPLYELAPDAAAFVTFIGATTAFFAASVGLFQNDIKRVIAYSTCSQLGYMFVAAGVSAYGAAMFHLFTHAFFKALLFLSAGAVIVALHHEQDLRNMGGLRKRLPFTYWMMLIGNLSLTGVGLPLAGVGMAGFYSKDAIINAAWAAGTPIGQYAFWLTLIAVAMTSFYSWRQFLMTFHGQYRGGGGHHAIRLEEVREPSHFMLAPLAVLATGAVLAGAIFVHAFIGGGAEGFWRGAVALVHRESEPPLLIEFAPLLLTALGFGIAWFFYILKPELPARLAARQGALYTFLYRKWFFDEIYDLLLVRPAMWIGRVLWKWGDGRLIDGLGPDGVAATVLRVTKGAVRLQSGYVYHYAFAMLIGVVALASGFMFGWWR